MFGHKSFLRLGELSDASITGLYKDSHELDQCTYSFSQGTDSDGKAQAEIRGGTISISIPGIPPNDIMEWAMDSRIYKDGVIVVTDSDEMPLEKIQFVDGACVAMNINYSQTGKAYIATQLVLQVRKITVGSTTLDNRWTGFND